MYECLLSNSHLLTIFGGGIWVTDPLEQNAILDLLQLVDREDAWPTYNTQETLRSQWGLAGAPYPESDASSSTHLPAIV